MSPPWCASPARWRPIYGNNLTLAERRHPAGHLRAHRRRSAAPAAWSGSLTTVEKPVELDETGKAAVITTAMALGVDASNAKAYSLGCGMELMPDPDRRLTLTGEKDALGMPRLKLDMRIADERFRRLSPHLDGTGPAIAGVRSRACCGSTTRREDWLADRWTGAIIIWAPPA